MAKSILMVGVGGQGTILASKILTSGLMEAGYDVKMSEIHGMSQRGGSVSSQIRYGEKVESPVIGQGEAQILIAFEKMEALRWLGYVNPKGTVVVDDTEIPTISTITGQEEYRPDVLDIIRNKVNTKVMRAGDMAEALGNRRVSNIILLGAVVKSMNLEHIDWEKIIRDNVKPAFADINIKALQTGMDAVA
jgi:indolepyruvate ferredoxin oxidoreductase beta subunit